MINIFQSDNLYSPCPNLEGIETHWVTISDRWYAMDTRLGHAQLLWTRHDHVGGEKVGAAFRPIGQNCRALCTEAQRECARASAVS